MDMFGIGKTAFFVQRVARETSGPASTPEWCRLDIYTQPFNRITKSAIYLHQRQGASRSLYCFESSAEKTSERSPDRPKTSEHGSFLDLTNSQPKT